MPERVSPRGQNVPVDRKSPTISEISRLLKVERKKRHQNANEKKRKRQKRNSANSRQTYPAKDGKRTDIDVNDFQVGAYPGNTQAISEKPHAIHREDTNQSRLLENRSIYDKYVSLASRNENRLDKIKDEDYYIYEHRENSFFGKSSVKFPKIKASDSLESLNMLREPILEERRLPGIGKYNIMLSRGKTFTVNTRGMKNNPGDYAPDDGVSVSSLEKKAIKKCKQWLDTLYR